MREDKRKRLEAKGWRVAQAEDFLELAPNEIAYIEIRFRLADGLKRKRLARGISQGELAKVVRSSQSRIAKMEAGDPTVSLDLLIRALLALGASGRDLGRMFAKPSPRKAA